MLDIIDKNCKTALSEQVSDKLIHEIRSGKIKPGKRMPGERQLAERFWISRGTVIEALDLLESQNYIERIPARGTFVADDVNHELSVIKIAFPFPEASISLTAIGSIENWAMVSEAYRGMIEEARKHNAEISFIHFEEASNDIQFSRQLRRLESADGAIFAGYQLAKLRQCLVNNGKYCALMGYPPEIEPDMITVANDLPRSAAELAAFARNKNYKRLRIISELNDITRQAVKKTVEEKLKVMRQAFEQTGIETNPDWCYIVDSTKPEDFIRVFADNDFELGSGTDIIYCSNANIVPAFYRYCFDNDIKLGKDISAFGYASGMTFTNLMPTFTYSKINNFEIGRRACVLCIEAIRSGRHSSRLELVKNTLIEGESV